jgi:hypothetical protein
MTMTPAEFRTIRKSMDHTQLSLSRSMGLTKWQVLRYENAHGPTKMAAILIDLLLEKHMADQKKNTTCPACDGQGYYRGGKRACPGCRGTRIKLS